MLNTVARETLFFEELGHEKQFLKIIEYKTTINTSIAVDYLLRE